MLRLRYAPSPTGLQHIGGLRTALFNYLVAAHHGGSFILRVEDTDRQRSNKESLQDLYESLAWLGLNPDESPQRSGCYAPYTQSERCELYKEHALILLNKGVAYRCFCGSKELEQMREQQQLEKSSTRGYDRRCRSLTVAESAARALSENHVIRFKVPLQGTVKMQDLLLGKMEQRCREINPDPVLLKSDGFPTYHLANVVDDHHMQISHVLRAQEWLPSLALHILLYEAFDWKRPEFCHLPMVLGEDGSKLSKRHGATSVREFREQGYLAEALINYLALLGWAYDGEQQLFSMKELIDKFSLSKLSASAATFDYKKLNWFNGVYIRACADERLAKLLLPFFMTRGYLTEGEEERLLPLLPLIKERITLLSQAPQMLSYFFEEPQNYLLEDAFPKKFDRQKFLDLLGLLDQALKNMNWTQAEQMEIDLRSYAQNHHLKFGQLLQPLRLAITGTKVSPPLFPSLDILGREICLQRWKNFTQKAIHG